MRVRVLIEMDDGASGIRAVNALDSAMREYNEKLRRAVPEAEIDFEVLGIVREAEVRAGVVTEEPEWEYGWRDERPFRWASGTNLPTSFPKTVYPYESRPGLTRVRRRKAGPWVPVKQEAAP